MVTWADEGAVCGALGCTETVVVFRVVAASVVRVLCPDHLSDYLRRRVRRERGGGRRA